MRRFEVVNKDIETNGLKVGDNVNFVVASWGDLYTGTITKFYKNVYNKVECSIKTNFKTYPHILLNRVIKIENKEKGMRRFEVVDKNIDTKLPTRADVGSAGYDFYSIQDFDIKPNEYVNIPTNIKVCMEQDEVLLLYVRSSIGIKKHLVLTNGTGVIDSTYYNNETNGGNIMCALHNVGDTIQHINKGDRLMQGVFVKYLTTDDDKPIKTHRNGGIGSSGI